MKTVILTAAVLSALALGADAPPGKVLFQDRFEKKVGPGWTWLRENPKTWKIEKGALEIRVEPGDANSVKNALVRPAPDRSKGRYAIEVTVTNTAKPTNQFEQLGITWYVDKKPVYKVVKELVDGKRYIISSLGSPARTPFEGDMAQIRLVIDGSDFTVLYRPEGKGEFKTAAAGKLPPPAPGKEEVSLQCYQGPPDAEHWMRFDDFRIIELPAGGEKK